MVKNLVFVLYTTHFFPVLVVDVVNDHWLAVRFIFFSIWHMYIFCFSFFCCCCYTLAIFWKTWYHFLSPPLYMCVCVCVFVRLPLFVIRCTFYRIVWLVNHFVWLFNRSTKKKEVKHLNCFSITFFRCKHKHTHTHIGKQPLS